MSSTEPTSEYEGQPMAQRVTLRRRLAHRLRYMDKPGTRRLSTVLDASGWQHVVMALTGSNYCGDYSDPPFAKTLSYPWEGSTRVFSADRDGMELWFGYDTEWRWHIDSDEVKALTRWLIVEWWIKARWLGLRRPIYYAALHSSVEKHRRLSQRFRDGDGDV